jgi:Imm-5 like putative immunity protein
MTQDIPKKTGTENQKLLAFWAANCAEHVLPLFERAMPGDDRPWQAIEAIRAWAEGTIKCGKSRDAAFVAHAAAREAKEKNQQAACAVARACGQAAAVAHMAGHAPHAAAYALQAVSFAQPDDAAHAAAAEREWQIQQLPEHLHPVGDEDLLDALGDIIGIHRNPDYVGRRATPYDMLARNCIWSQPLPDRRLLCLAWKEKRLRQIRRERRNRI